MTPGDLVRVVRGVHQGRDGKLLSVAHEVCEIESWRDRDEVLIVFERDVEPLAPSCPDSQRAACARGVLAELETARLHLLNARKGIGELGDHDDAATVNVIALEVSGLMGRRRAKA